MRQPTLSWSSRKSIKRRLRLLRSGRLSSNSRL